MNQHPGKKFETRHPKDDCGQVFFDNPRGFREDFEKINDKLPGQQTIYK